MHRLVILLAAAALLVLPARASADGATDAWNEGSQIATEARSTSAERPPASAGRHVSAETCHYEALDAEPAATADMLAAKGWGNARGAGPGSWFRKICTDAAGMESASVVWVPPRRTSPRDLAEEATDKAPLPVPAIHLSPPSTLYVNVETWLWIDPSQWQPVVASATAGSVTATATAVPQSVTWSMGNGDTVTCAGPGTAYHQGDVRAGVHPACGYTYRHSSARGDGGWFTVSATVTWSVTWTAAGAPGGGSLGTVTRTAEVRVQVAEIQVLNR